MLKKNKVKTEYITIKVLEKTIDRRLEEQDKRFTKTIDQRFSEQDKRFDERMDKRFEEYTKIILDAFDSRFDKVDVRIDELRTDISAVQATVDNHLKMHADSDQEFVIVKAEVGQMKQVFKQKLGVEIRAF